MWERYPDAMPRALERHEHLLRETVETRGGRIFKNVGDGLFVAFSASPPAVDAALVAQRSLCGEEWPTSAPVRVRMALHSAHAEERAGDYFGPPLNRVARILSAGYGGHLLSVTGDDGAPRFTRLRTIRGFSTTMISAGPMCLAPVYPERQVAVSGFPERKGPAKWMYRGSQIAGRQLESSRPSSIHHWRFTLRSG